MCGIAGIALNPHVTLPDLRERLLGMREAMVHRGPDDAGLYMSPDNRLGLANCRLAIRDLSSAGHMPMSNADGMIWITYNGEIYNIDELRPELECLGYTFRSRSDTEVILHGYEAWGDEIVQRLRGMFAFAILTLERSTSNVQRLFLARDRLGIKPLYYAVTSKGFLFASELKALQASGLISRQISPVGLVGYLMLGSVPNPWTIYDGVCALPPASTLVWGDGRIEIKRYWELPVDTVEMLRYEEAVEQTRVLLEEAVRIRLVSDVPLGAFLSGGLDSSAVVALMRRASNGPIYTCSMVFEEEEYSEASYARSVAEAVGAEHYERVIMAQDVVNELDRIIWAMDQPTVDGVNTYFVSKTAREAGLTVALSGLGGDELFGGYPNTFQGVPQMLRVLRLTQKVPAARALIRAAIDLLPDRRRWAKVADALVRPPSRASAYLARRGLFSPTEAKALVVPDIWEMSRSAFDPLIRVSERADAPFSDDGSGFTWTSRAELCTYTHHQLLRDTDAMSMAHSLEVRVPLLDQRLVELILRIPETFKQNGSRPKSLMLAALGDALPAAVRNRTDKQGFTFPFERWLQKELSSILKHALSPSTVRSQGLLNVAETSKVMHDYSVGRAHWSRAWGLAALNLWLSTISGR